MLHIKLYKDDNKLLLKNQLEILIDKKNDGNERPWKDKKMYNEYLKESYKRLSLCKDNIGLGYDKKVERAYCCECYLEFKELADGKLKLNKGYFFQIRLCALCNWRRELKLFAQLSNM